MFVPLCLVLLQLVYSSCTLYIVINILLVIVVHHVVKLRVIEVLCLRDKNLKTYPPLKLLLPTMAQLRFRYYKNLSNPAPPVSQLIISLVVINHFTHGLKK